MSGSGGQARWCGDRSLYILSVLVMASGVLAIVVSIAPLYVYRGVFTGYISLVDYRLEMFGERVYMDVLERVRLLSILVLAVAVYTIASGLYLVFSLKKTGHLEKALYIVLSASVTVFTEPLLLYIARVHIDVALGYIPGALRMTTSAGLLDLGETRVSQTLYTGLFLLSPIVFLALAIVSTTLSVLNIYRLYREDLIACQRVSARVSGEDTFS